MKKLINCRVYVGYIELDEDTTILTNPNLVYWHDSVRTILTL